jgi:hypothetical protein
MPSSAPVVRHQCPILEIVHHGVHYVDEGIDYASKLKTGFKAIAASRSFRNYGLLNLLQGSLPKNAAGNFRGMIISQRWKAAFYYISEHTDTLENVGTIASFAANIANLGHEFETAHRSSADSTLRGMRYASLAGTAAERTLAGIVTGAVHLTYMSLRGDCMMMSLLGGTAQKTANQCISTLNRADSFVKASVDTITDTSNQAYAIYHPVQAGKAAYWWVVNMRFVPRQ